MTLLLTLPIDRSAPLRWVADIVFGEMLGVTVAAEEGAETGITLSGEGRSLTMPSLFPDLDRDRTQWADQLPRLPLATWDAAELPDVESEAPLPILFGQPELTVDATRIHCGVDILGAIFFMLSRFEEVALPDRDQHERFPAVASLAWRAGFLYRPIVDEYVELLWAMMKRLWPGLERRHRQGEIKVSCDVDRPFDPMGRDPVMLLKVLRHEILLKRNLPLAARRAANFFLHRQGNLRFDPFFTFDWYMDVCESIGCPAAFYFIADHSAGALDGTYAIDEPRILTLMQQLAGRGHEIGMHGSYNSYHDAGQIRKERERLLWACEMAAVRADVRGNRQHYLRWDAAETPDHLDEAGFAYDTSGSYADRPGFRYGTSRPFPMWSWRRHAPLRLRQHPLVLMECSVLSPNYLGMGHSDEAIELMLMLKRRALAYGGDFTVLWHNSELVTAADRNIFADLIR